MTMLMQATPSIPEMMNAMWPANNDAIDAALKVWSHWLDDWTEVQQESLHFLQDRMSRDMAAVTHIAACRSPTEVFDLHFRHTCEAAADYVAETQKLVTLMGRAATNSFAAAKPAA